jgi:hypothetical protein
LETKSLIENGKIKTGLINADAIVTDELISEKIAAATITANSVVTKDTTGAYCELDKSTFKIKSESGEQFVDMGEFSERE